MVNKYNKKRSLFSLLNKSLLFSNVGKFRSNRFCVSKRFVLRKGFTWRSFFFKFQKTGNHVGSYLSSRKPKKRIGGTKRR